MENKVLQIILIVIGTVVMLMMPPFNLLIGLGFWIFLGIMLKKKRVLDGTIEPQLAQKRLKRFKTLGIIAAISFLIALVGIVMHNVQSATAESEEAVYFFIGIISLYIFIISSIVGFILYLRTIKVLK